MKIRKDLEKYEGFRIDLKLGLLHIEQGEKETIKWMGYDTAYGGKIIGFWEEYWLSKSTIKRILAVIHDKGLKEGKSDLIIKRGVGK